MLVGNRMSHPVITIAPDLPISEALNLLKREHIRRAPVVQDGKLVGMISDKDLLNASPSPVTTLSIWEMNYLLSKVLVRDVMSKKVLTVDEETPIEAAARIMADNKIGGLPVMRGQDVVGIITETDLFKIFLEMFGAREAGVRVTVQVPDRRGEIAKLAKTIADAGGNIIAFGTFAGEAAANYTLTFKVAGLPEAQVRQLVEPLVNKLVDIRSATI